MASKTLSNEFLYKYQARYKYLLVRKVQAFEKESIFKVEILFDAQFETFKVPLFIGWRDWLFKAYLCALYRPNQAIDADQ